MLYGTLQAFAPEIKIKDFKVKKLIPKKQKGVLKGIQEQQTQKNLKEITDIQFLGMNPGSSFSE